ncbi:ATP-binding protein [Deinococcus apachensis]|uniref:ATP-binding protein n=1 Tax=Deinococcus apachensis TaxID=309886 RepID=UPI00036ECAB0|nr:helix-turn-helix transcriptional regulator [Deinococcus apachensis]
MVLERAPFLAELTRLLGEAAAGQGRLVFVGGEAGVGKTTLVGTFCRDLGERVRVAIGACDPLSTPRPLGPLLDVAGALGGLEALGDSSRDGAFRMLLAKLGADAPPTLVVFEDVHWADEATLDLLRFLGRRMGSGRGLLIATYRDDEVGTTHPLRTLLGDLATSAAVRRLALPPLSMGAAAQLAQGSGLDAALLHRQTGGNPFFITEILAAGGEAMPATVRDAVLARAARLSPASRAVLEAASVIGARVEARLLSDVVGAELGAVEGCLESGVLLAQPEGFAFRHELGRQAVLGVIPPHRRRVLHALVLDALRREPAPDPARLAHHAEEAGDGAAVLDYAPQAARRAAQLKAHREAAGQYARALRFAGTFDPDRRAPLLEAYAYECYLTDQLGEAAKAREQALELWRALGEAQKEGENLRWLSRLHWFLGRNAEAERYARDALAVLEPHPPGTQLAMAYSNLSQLRMLAADVPGAVFWGERAAALARQLGDTATLSHALNNVHTARLEATPSEDWAGLEESLRLALASNLEEHAARAWTNLASLAVKHWQVDRARGYLEDGIAYATDHDLDAWRLYMQGWQALWLVYQARWNEAGELAQALTHNPRVSPVSRIQALVALGRIRARRGDPEVWSLLDEALSLAEPTGEFQRLGIVRTARAEAFWLAGDPERAAGEAASVYDLALSKGQPWLLGELAYWRWRAGALPSLPTGIAQPFALQMAGRPLEAARAWRALNAPYEAARALTESDDEPALKEALVEVERLGARPLAQRVTRRLRERGATGIPRGPRPATRTHPAGLTSREVEVLNLLAGGQRDKQIARQLNLSEKTVGHHVSAILAKLDRKSRAEAVLEARRQGILPT